jgi:hypothetical protein
MYLIYMLNTTEKNSEATPLKPWPTTTTTTDSKIR